MPAISDFLETAAGKIPVITDELNLKDRLGTLQVRLSIRRMKYAVEAGLYAIGEPDQDSPVLVSANYKLSFDSLRKELRKLNAWILVLDTKGINVWCAAGKRTFGTDELIERINTSGLEKIVKHRNLIVPQLGAPGVAAHKVKEETGFEVIYGPVRAGDLPEFLRRENQATLDMRKVHFGIIDRLTISPVEVVMGLKSIAFVSILFLVLSGLNRNGYSLSSILHDGGGVVICLITAYLSGTFFVPMLLPYIPGRAFALKGFLLVIPFFLILFTQIQSLTDLHNLEKLSWLLIMGVISSFYAMNFTGASTYTSLSGVRKEMRFAVPIQITAITIGFIIWLVFRFA